MSERVPRSGAARGRFITFEGGEGVGKSVQAKRLAAALAARGIAVTLTREPGGTPGAEEIRALLVTGATGRWTPATETLLYAAARADHLARLVRPTLAAGGWVISDRFADSTLVYQSAGQGLDHAFVEDVSRLVVGTDWPDFTLVLDIDVETGLARALARASALGSAETRYERYDRAFHERLRAAYRDLAARASERCVLIEAGHAEDAVAAEIWARVATRFGL